MELTLYANNYRGFKEITLDIDRTTFIVGDNSSGKTSIISLIELILRTGLEGTPQLHKEFTSDRNDFFSKYFDYADVTIGFVAKVDEKHSGRMITFKKSKGYQSPDVIKTTIVSDRYGIVLQKQNGKVRSRHTNIEKIDKIDIKLLKNIHFSDEKLQPTSLLVRDGINKMMNFIEVAQEKISSKSKGVKFSSVINLNFPFPHSHHIGPLRGKPERTYDFEHEYQQSGAHFASMWIEMRGKRNAEVTKFVDKFGKESKLFDKLKVRKMSRRLEKSPLVATVERGGKDFLLDQVGIGVSQVAPIMVEALFYVNNRLNAVMLMQQPELHLHPIAQAALGEFFFDTNTSHLVYIMETHSDFLIDRYRANLRDKGKTEGDNGQIWFCRNTPKGNSIRNIKIDTDGNLINPPKEYRRFFIDEILRTMI